MAVSFENWPEVPPEQRPQRLYVAEALSVAVVDYLTGLGWLAVDVRTLPNKKPADKAESIAATMEGVRLGSIAMSPAQFKIFELEAKSLGLLTGKAPEAKKDEDVFDLAAVLTFTSPRAWRGTQLGTDGKPQAKTAAEVLDGDGVKPLSSGNGGKPANQPRPLSTRTTTFNVPYVPKSKQGG